MSALGYTRQTFDRFAVEIVNRVARNYAEKRCPQCRSGAARFFNWHRSDNIERHHDGPCVASEVWKMARELEAEAGKA
jgi:hypothetical protein